MISGTSYIYALVDPRTSAVFYIGTTKEPLRRLRTHATTSKNQQLRSRLAELHAQGVKPKMRILETVTGETRASREKHWVLHHLKQGCDLCNISILQQHGRRLTIQEIENTIGHERVVFYLPAEQRRYIDSLASEWECDRRTAIGNLLDIALGIYQQQPTTTSK